MDFFEPNKQEILSSSLVESGVNGEALGGAERSIVVPDRAYERLTQPTAERVGESHKMQTSPISAVPASAVVRQSIVAADRFKNLEAAGGDVIESSWVSGVKKTIELTKNHPNLRDQQINQIRKIYQEKRKVS